MKLGEHKVKFEFTGPPNRELPHIAGQLPVLSKSGGQRETFKTLLEPPMGSGPYRIVKFEAGRYVKLGAAQRLVGRKFTSKPRPQQF